MSSIQELVAAYEARKREHGVPMEGGVCIAEDHTGHDHGGLMTKRFLIRDEWDGVFFETDDRDEAEHWLRTEGARFHPKYELRIDDMED